MDNPEEESTRHSPKKNIEFYNNFLQGQIENKIQDRAFAIMTEKGIVGAFEDVSNNYDRAARSLDNILGPIVQQLEKEGLLPKNKPE